MEELILIAVFGIIALIAMSQCAHHSSHRHAKRFVRPTEQAATDAARSWKHAVVHSDNPDDPVPAESIDRDPCPK